MPGPRQVSSKEPMRPSDGASETKAWHGRLLQTWFSCTQMLGSCSLNLVLSPWCYLAAGRGGGVVVQSKSLCQSFLKENIPTWHRTDSGERLIICSWLSTEEKVQRESCDLSFIWSQMKPTARGRCLGWLWGTVLKRWGGSSRHGAVVNESD